MDARAARRQAHQIAAAMIRIEVDVGEIPGLELLATEDRRKVEAALQMADRHATLGVDP